MLFLAISIAVSAVLALPLPQGNENTPEENTELPPIDPTITWDKMPVRMPPKGSSPEPDEEDPSTTLGKTSLWTLYKHPSIYIPPKPSTDETDETDEDPLQMVFDGLQQAVDTSGRVLEKVPLLPQLGAAAGAAYKFFNPPAAPADASPGS